jgi:hypothetical protein
MAIEIREVVIKASVNKSVGSGKTDFVTKAELQKLHDKMVARILGSVRDMIEEQRSFR